MSNTILIVDDDASQRKTLGMLLVKRLGYKILEAENGRDCLDILGADHGNAIKLIILDLRMPVLGGIETLQKIREAYTYLPVIMLTATKEIDDVVEVMKLGATDFMSKPVQAERMIVSVNNALKMKSLSDEVTRLKYYQNDTIQFDSLVGSRSGLKDIVDTGRKAAGSDIPVLITGETGVGKEVFARSIHGESARAGKPFIAVNCGAIPSELVESTLFGHKKGSFTGAIADSLGKFREADGGTIFLDEVGELHPDTQVKLLRVLQQKEVEPVGAGKSEPVNVRVISATNKNMEEEVQDGKFREDLYFRLNVLNIEIPPLRARKGDILNLAEHFIERFAAQENRPVRNITENGQKALQNHTWPGNVRELENTIYRAMVLSDKAIFDEDDFVLKSQMKGLQNIDQASFISLCNDKGDLKRLDTLEMEIVHHAISYNNDNISKAAKDLGIAKSTLYRKINETEN